MPSYVLKAQEIAPSSKTTTTTKINRNATTKSEKQNEALSPQRNLSLNLSPQYDSVQQSNKQQQQKQTILKNNNHNNNNNKYRKLQQKQLSTTASSTDANMLAANVGGGIGSSSSSSSPIANDDDQYNECALLLRGAENSVVSGMQQMPISKSTHFERNSNKTSNTNAALKERAIVKTTNNKINNNINSNNINKNYRNNNYGSTTMFARNNVDMSGGGGDYVRVNDDDDTLSDVVTSASASATKTASGATSIHLSQSTGANFDDSINEQQQQHQQINQHNNYNDNTRQNPTTISNNTNANKKTKMCKLGSKNVGLKRVSFGSSKGSMVETLVFETPTPLSEHVEPAFGFEIQNQKSPTNNQQHIAYPYKANMDDSGIEILEESERSIVRVSIYQSSRPQQICPPEYLTRFEEQDQQQFDYLPYNIDEIMTATATTMPGYDRQQSTDSGWDNPFRPGGDLSREADEIVNLIRGGKPITPTEGQGGMANGNAQRGTADNLNGTATAENVTKSNITQTQSAQNGTNTHRTESSKTGGIADNNNGVTTTTTTSSSQVSKQVVPGPTSASHVVIDEKKNKKKGCCVIQ